jgi:hypothetical protein
MKLRIPPLIPLLLAPLVCAFGDCFEQERQFIRQSLQVVTTLAAKVQEIAQGADATVTAALAGDLAGASQTSEPFRVGMENAVEFLQEAWTEFQNSSPGEKGQVFGRVTFEIASIALPLSKPGQIAGKLEFLARLSSSASVAGDARLAAAAGRTFTRLGEVAQRTPNSCFVAGTRVLTWEGPRSIESVQVGTRVLSRDPQTGQQGWKRVLATFVTHPARLYHVRYRMRNAGGSASGSAGTEVRTDEDEHELACTGEHPFYDAVSQRFVPAEDLKVGTRLSLASGAAGELVAIRVVDPPSGQRITTYNFEVADWHTYFVGEAGVWVHNQGRACDRIRAIFDRFGKPPHNLDPNEALKRTFERMPAAVFGRPMLGAVEDANRLAYANAAAAGGNPMFVRSVEWWNEVMRGRKGSTLRGSRNGYLYSGSYFEVNHIVPKEIQKALGIALHLDACPGLPVAWFQHDGARFLGGFHTILREEMDARGLVAKGGSLSKEDAIIVLKAAYSRMKWSNGMGMDDVGKVAETWIELFTP